MKGENETRHVQGRWPKWPLTAHPPGHLVITAPLVITAWLCLWGKEQVGMELTPWHAVH